MTQLTLQGKKKKVIGFLIAKLIALLFCKVMQCEKLPAWGLKPKPQIRKTAEWVLYLHCLTGLKLVQQDKYVISLSVSIFHTGRANSAGNIPGLLWLRGFILVSFCFSVRAPYLLLVMLIAWRPPAERDAFPVWKLWSCLPKEMSLCVFIAHGYNALQKSLLMLHTCARVIMCVCVL